MKYGICLMFAAMLLVSMAFAPAASAKKNVNDGTDGNITTKSASCDVTFDIDPYQGALGSDFDFEGDATYELDVYGIPLPTPATFANDISYDAFYQPEVISASNSGGYVYKSDTNIGKAWTHRYYMYVFGGPTTKSIHSYAEAKKKGTYSNRLHASLIGNSDVVYANAKIV